MAVLFVRVDERARTRETRRRVDDLVAVDGARAALGLVLRTERECLLAHLDELCGSALRRRKT